MAQIKEKSQREINIAAHKKPKGQGNRCDVYPPGSAEWKLCSTGLSSKNLRIERKFEEAKDWGGMYKHRQQFEPKGSTRYKKGVRYEE